MLHVLLVEDEPDIALVAQMLLEDAGYRVELAADGQEGLARALAEPPPDAVVTDFMMPRMDGLQMIRTLRAAGFARPIMLTSAVEEPALPEHPGYDRYLAKPYRSRELLDNVSALLHGRDPPG
jgi:CheY-like chemotaxis protein